jgi:hypothetical protein
MSEPLVDDSESRAALLLVFIALIGAIIMTSLASFVR